MRNSTWSATISLYITEGRTVSGGKGDDTAKQAEKQQLDFNGQLMKIFSAQYGQQKDVLSFLQNKLEPNISNPQGLDQSTKSAMTANAIDTNATNYQNALKGVQANTASRSGATTLPSGVDEQIRGQLAGQEAGTQTAALQNIQTQDAQLKQQNYWNSVNALNGVSAQINPLGYSSSANQGGGTLAGLSSAYSSSQQTGFWNTLGNSFAGGLGKGLATGGNAALFGA